MNLLFEMLTFKCLWGMKRDDFTLGLTLCCIALWLVVISLTVQAVDYLF